MQFKDYYQTLGVEPGAGDAEIKTAYRRLARKYHPDVSKEAGAEERFKAINEAYEVLRDKEKCRRAKQVHDAHGLVAPIIKNRHGITVPSRPHCRVQRARAVKSRSNAASARAR